MENKINKIITLDNEVKYMIVDQGNYNEKCYFLVSKLDNENNLTDTFSIVEETIIDNEKLISSVKDEKLLKSLANYFNKRVS